MMDLILNTGVDLYSWFIFIKVGVVSLFLYFLGRSVWKFIRGRLWELNIKKGVFDIGLRFVLCLVSVLYLFVFFGSGDVNTIYAIPDGRSLQLEEYQEKDTVTMIDIKKDAQEKTDMILENLNTFNMEKEVDTINNYIQNILEEKKKGLF